MIEEMRDKIANDAYWFGSKAREFNKINELLTAANNYADNLIGYLASLGVMVPVESECELCNGTGRIMLINKFDAFNSEWCSCHKCDGGKVTRHVPLKDLEEG